MISRTKTIALGIVVLAGAGTAITAQRQHPAHAAATVAHLPQTQPGRLRVVELFQSQGCSDCPPAEANLNTLADDPNILALSYGVTYWDNGAWKDSFATPQFTARQWAYAHDRQRGNVWTPQVYVDGKADVVGSNRAQLDQTIRASSVTGPTVTLRGQQVSVGAGTAPEGGATVWLVRYDPRTLNVAIRGGENGGRTLPHRNIVRQLVSLGTWHGRAQRFAVPAGPAGLAAAALVQVGAGGAILAAAKG